MKLQLQIAKHLNDVFYGGNWTWSNVKGQLDGVTCQEANTKVGDLNTIVALVYHIHYYVAAQLSVLSGNELNASDKFSFNHPEISSEEAWEAMMGKVFKDVDDMIALVEALPEEMLEQDFADPQYGSYFRNLIGMIEHTHYHLGQIVVIKKLISA